jgi:hypothetical protein
MNLSLITKYAERCGWAAGAMRVAIDELQSGRAHLALEILQAALLKVDPPADKGATK